MTYRRTRRLRPKHLVPLAAVWLGAGPALARDLTAPERAALAETVRGYETAMHDGQADRVVATLPPRILAAIAADNNVTPADLRQSIESQITKLKAEGVKETVTLDLAQAHFASLGDGTPYVLIPTHVVAEGARKVDSRFDTLGLMDGGRWYLVDVSTPQRVATFDKAFPEFAGIDFGGKTLETKP